jgi:4-amino-4-deoxy-L-arabinose transferase-like glycosyltransferase
MQAVTLPAAEVRLRPDPSTSLAPPALGAREALLAAALVIGYFGAQVAMRVAISDALELDEAEQSLWTQSFEFGYGPQPPLYTWLQMIVFEVLGPSVLGLALLKNALLSITYGSLWLAARRLMPAPLAATVALCPLLLVQIGWNSQRDLTHSVLATTLASLSFLLVLRLVERPSALTRWGALGLALGLGALSKYNFVGFAAVLLAAVLALPEARAALRSPRAWVGAVVLGGAALAVFAPHGVWLLDHASAASENTLHKLAGGPMSRGSQIIRGAGSLALATVAFLSPLWLLLLGLFGAAWWRGRGHNDAPPPDFAHGDDAALRTAFARRLGRNYALTLIGFFAVLIVVGGASQIKQRWLQPFLVMAPALAVAAAPWLASHPRRRVLHMCCAVAALCWLTWVGGRVVTNGMRATPDEQNEPAAALAAALRSSGALPEGPFTLISSDRVLAGSLRLQFPQARAVVAPDAAALDAIVGGRGRAPSGSEGDGEAVQGPVAAILRGEGPTALALERDWIAMLGSGVAPPAAARSAGALGPAAGEPAGDPVVSDALGWRFPVLYARSNGPTVVYRVWVQR